MRTGIPGRQSSHLTLPTIHIPAFTDFGGGYSGIESGTIDPETGTLEGIILIYQERGKYEEGLHTYTKQKKIIRLIKSQAVP